MLITTLSGFMTSKQYSVKERGRKITMTQGGTNLANGLPRFSQLIYRPIQQLSEYWRLSCQVSSQSRYQASVFDGKVAWSWAMVKLIRVDNTKFYSTYLKKFWVNSLQFTAEIKTECIASFYHLNLSHIRKSWNQQDKNITYLSSTSVNTRNK